MYIFISADCWLCVFDLLEPSQLGFGIALISHRFDFYVDEHFKTRKWALKIIHIERKIGENGTKEMAITNDNRKSLPIPKMLLPRKVIGFKYISINFIDRNAIAFLHRFRPIFASCPINLFINTTSDRILALILHNIWPMIEKTFMPWNSVAKWLFTPFPNNVPKVIKCAFDGGRDWPPKMAALKAAFTDASSRVNFIVVICFSMSFAASVVPFALTNELTREQLAFKSTRYTNEFLLIRRPIARDESKWTKWEKEAFDWEFFDEPNRIYIQMDDENRIGDGLLDAIPGPSDQK
ncbi:hypothetical protein niasHT_039066 [Heterodera trifolii]|uniref:Uncharacterized protein n=1 Tax=Heterodera trifolii TaxID=157864 RepID=A0ABD2HU44_9BILA